MEHEEYKHPSVNSADESEAKINLQRYFRVALDIAKQSVEVNFDISVQENTMTERSTSNLEG